MGFVYTDITLKNVKDIMKAEEGLINEAEIRHATVQAMVDTGARTLVISEAIRRQLGLELKEERRATLANKTTVMCNYTEPVDIHWKNRSCSVRALVLPDTAEILLGAIPLEDMDLIIDPARQELTGAHGDEAVSIIY